MDVLKFVVTFTLGAVFTITVLHEFEEERSLRSFQWRKAWERDLQISDEFREASLLYVQTTKGALTEVSGGPEGETVREWKGPAHSRLLLSLEAVKYRFAPRDPKVAKLIEKLDRKRIGLYEEYLTLRKREDKPGGYTWSKTLHEFISLRSEIAKELEYIIEGPPTSFWT